METFTFVDYANKNGDYTCKLYGHMDKNGIMIVDRIDFIDREVKNKMAIDYKKEWFKLRTKYGPKSELTYTMDDQIRDTINKREKLMEEYVKENMATEICDGDKDFHHIKIVNTRTRGVKSPLGTMYIHKKDFAAWCKKKGGE